MSIKYPQIRADSKLVLRDETGRLVKTKPVEPFATVIEMPKAKNWRAAIRRQVGGDGSAIWETWFDLMQGKVFTPRHVDADGTVHEGEPMVPSFEVRRAAARDLAEFAFGKPVAQTEIVKAEEESETMAQLNALSDDAIAAKMRELVEANTNKQAVVEHLPRPTDDD